MTVQTRFTELLKEENRKDAKAPYRIKFRSGGFTHTNAEGFKGWKPTGMVEFSYEVWWNNRVHTRAEVVFDSQNGALISFGEWKGDGH